MLASRCTLPCLAELRPKHHFFKDTYKSTKANQVQRGQTRRPSSWCYAALCAVLLQAESYGCCSHFLGKGDYVSLSLEEEVHGNYHHWRLILCGFFFPFFLLGWHSISEWFLHVKLDLHWLLSFYLGSGDGKSWFITHVQLRWGGKRERSWFLCSWSMVVG